MINAVRTKFRLLVPAVTGLLIALSSSYGYAQFSFTKLIDTSAFMPGQSFQYTDISATHFDGNSVFISGYNSVEEFGGLYTYNQGSVSVNVDNSFTIPGTNDNFRSVFAGSPVVNGRFAFAGQDQSLNHGLYRIENGNITTAANQNTAIPGTTDNFGFFLSSWMTNSGTLVFQGGTNVIDTRIYAEQNGNITTIADYNTAVPGYSGNFMAVRGLRVIGDDIYFRGSGDPFHSGYYSNATGTLSAIVDTNDFIPGTNDNFTGIVYADTHNGQSAFVGLGNQYSGVFLTENNVITTLVDSNSVIPGLNANEEFTFTGVNIHDGNVLFAASDEEGNSGLFLINSMGELSQIYLSGELFDGKEVERVIRGFSPIVDNKLVLSFEFVDQTEAIYLFDIGTAIPEPGSLSLLATIAFGILNRRRRR